MAAQASTLSFFVSIANCSVHSWLVRFFLLFPVFRSNHAEKLAMIPEEHTLNVDSQQGYAIRLRLHKLDRYSKRGPRLRSHIMQHNRIS